MFPLDGITIKYKGEEVKLADVTYAVLKEFHPGIADLIDEFELTIMSVVADDEREINGLFIRLNLNVSISAPEARNAMLGPVPQLIRSVALHGIFTDKITFPTLRGQRLNVAAKIILI